MDLGIRGKWALVCAASKGLGKGCAGALVREGVNVVITARGAQALEATAAELRALGADQRPTSGDTEIHIPAPIESTRAPTVTRRTIPARCPPAARG